MRNYRELEPGLPAGRQGENRGIQGREQSNPAQSIQFTRLRGTAGDPFPFGLERPKTYPIRAHLNGRTPPLRGVPQLR